MAEQEISGSFNPDRPIYHAGEDLLGRNGFAHRLAEQIARWKGSESLVIALYGDWGTGKTSLKNLILEHLDTHRPAPTAIEFNPWMVSGEEAITRSFFDEILACLKSLPHSAAQQKRAETWRKYATGFGVAAKIAGAAEVAGLFVPLVGQIGSTARRSLENAADIAKSASDVLGDRPSIEKMRKELRRQFASLEQPIIIVLDDIDRLTVDEICLIFRLVKANADFPKLIFLLLFQRESAEKALDRISNNRGKDFLQKIVQVGFDLPTPSQGELNAVLFKQLDQSMEGKVSEKDWERQRWANLWVGLQPYFSNLRENYRFLNSFGFHLAGFFRGGALEVNPVDLIGIETLRVFEPEIHRRISQEEYLLTSLQTETRDAAKELGENLLSARRGTEEQVKTILSQLFPVFEGLWNNHGWGDGFQRMWTKTKRVCTKAFFGRYFSLEIWKNQATEAEVQVLLATVNDREKLRQLLHRLCERGVILSVLKRLEAEDSLDKMPAPQSYLLALVDISDEIHEEEREWLISSPAYWYVRRAVRRVLEPLDEVKRTSLLDLLIRDSTALFLPGDWITDMEDKSKEETIYPNRTQDELKQLKDIWVKRVRRAAKSAKVLLSVQGLRRVLRLWLEWDEPGRVLKWIAGLKSTAHLLNLLAAFINKSTSQGIGSAYVHDHSWIAWEDSLEQYGDEKHWRRILTRLNRSKNLTDAQKKTRRLFQATMERWRRGQQDDDPRKFEDRFPTE
jgi:hypothetical protein